MPIVPPPPRDFCPKCSQMVYADQLLTDEGGCWACLRGWRVCYSCRRLFTPADRCSCCRRCAACARNLWPRCERCKLGGHDT